MIFKILRRSAGFSLFLLLQSLAMSNPILEMYRSVMTMNNIISSPKFLHATNLPLFLSLSLSLSLFSFCHFLSLCPSIFLCVFLSLSLSLIISLLVSDSVPLSLSLSLYHSLSLFLSLFLSLSLYPSIFFMYLYINLTISLFSSLSHSLSFPSPSDPHSLCHLPLTLIPSVTCQIGRASCRERV